MKQRDFLLLLCLVFSVFSTGCPAPCDANQQEILLIRNELAPLVQALELYKKEHKTYPQSLQNLYPLHVTVDEYVAGRKLTYHRISENRYNLNVHSRSGSSYSGSCSASVIEEKWTDLNKNR
jgi:hypothetical protein